MFADPPAIVVADPASANAPRPPADLRVDPPAVVVKWSSNVARDCAEWGLVAPAGYEMRMCTIGGRVQVLPNLCGDQWKNNPLAHDFCDEIAHANGGEHDGPRWVKPTPSQAK